MRIVEIVALGVAAMTGRVERGGTLWRSGRDITAIRSHRTVALAMAALTICVTLGTANYLGWLRLSPEVAAVGWIEDKADFSSHMVNIQKLATVRATGRPDSFLPLYDIQHPGLFLLVAELYTRAGAATPVPLEITSIVLYNIAAVCFFFWVYLLFGDLMVATFATAFLTLSQFFLFFPGVTHTFPYEFCFFNLTMLLYLLYLTSNRTLYFAGALIAMFLTCMNYWFYYLSSWIIMLGLWWQYRGRPGFKEIAMISAPPLAAASLTVGMVMWLFGVKAGALRLVDIFLARTIDARLAGGQWYPDQRFLGAADWLHYPSTIATRLDWAFSTWVSVFAPAAICAFILLWSHDRKAFVSGLILAIGGFTWYAIMIQHTHIHWFVGQYSFMAMCPVFGLLMAQTVRLSPAAYRAVVKRLRSRVLVFSIDREELPDGRAAVALLIFGWITATMFVVKTGQLVTEAVALSRKVEVKYAVAVQTACRTHHDVTLNDLQTASADWGFVWRPELITETNQTPRC